MTINDHSVTQEAVNVEDIPTLVRPGYAAILNEFLASGEKAVRLTLWEGANPLTVSSGLRGTITKQGANVNVMVRNKQVYIVREF